MEAGTAAIRRNSRENSLGQCHPPGMRNPNDGQFRQRRANSRSTVRRNNKPVMRDGEGRRVCYFDDRSITGGVSFSEKVNNDLFAIHTPQGISSGSPAFFGRGNVLFQARIGNPNEKEHSSAFY